MLIPVILSGGAGTRLWPASRRARPKPFLKLGDGESLALKTLRRALAVSDSGEVMTITGRDYYFQAKDIYHTLPEADPDKQLFLLEPFGRNTAPAILLAALSLQARFGDDVCMLVLAADHLIHDTEAFSVAVDQAEELAEQGYLTTFGIKPLQPETGFGYIKAGEAIEGEACSEVAAFVEKPDFETAQAYLESGEYTWNSGMFCFMAKTLIDTARELDPQLFQACLDCWHATDKNHYPMELEADSFNNVPDISFDYAIMEKAPKRAVIRAEFDWNDIGSWKAMSELTEGDDAGNRLIGKTITVDSEHCFIQTDDDHLVAAVGVKDLVIVETGDCVLVAHKERVQDVKDVVKQLKDWEDDAAIHHKTTLRPWGSFTVLQDSDHYKVKRITVKPGGILSLQRHQHRSEHWTVVAGEAHVRIGDDEKIVHVNESVYVPVGWLHRLQNPGSHEIELIEVQCGHYLGEDDIERLEDVYGRNKTIKL